jgi:hypothetical protein
MQRAESDEHSEKLDDSMRRSFEMDSNVTVESLRHALKQFSDNISTDEGMQIDESDEHSENAEDSIRAK